MKTLVWSALIAVSVLLGRAQDLGQTSTVRIGVLKGGAYEVVTLPLETYVARVLAGEALPNSAPAALEALAVAIRTYALTNRGKHRADGFDLCDQTHCQVMRPSTLATEQAALETAGRVLLYRGSLATVYYSASCGGRTEKPSNVWPGAEDVPYLPSREDDGCGGSPEWSTELSGVDLQRALTAAGFRGTLRDLRIASHNESGRVQELIAEGMTPGRISGQDLRAAVGRAIGWQYLQSTAFELKSSGAVFRFKGHGAGHGVGMCVIGSAKLASAGESWEQILDRYFPGTSIGTVAPRLTAVPPERPVLTAPNTPRINAAPPTAPPAVVTDVSVSLPEGDEGERVVVATLVSRERARLIETLSLPTAPRVSVRFFPTTAAYESATGKPWFTIGTVADSELQFVPLTMLRERGLLERAVRQQLVHVLADAAFARRPAWVRQGAALHFADGRTGPPNRGTCPTEAELERPVSASALSDAYARARACFERELAAGVGWRDVR